MSQKEVAALSSLLGRLKTQSTSKKKKGGKAKSAGQPPSTPGTSGQVVTQKTGRSKRRKRKAAMGDGTITLSRRELVMTVTTTGTTPSASGLIALVPSDTVMPWLANLCKAFERIVWVSLEIEWVPMVGTTQGGAVIYGVDWANAVAANPDRQKVSALTPVVDHPVWQGGRLQLPPASLQSRRFYSLLSTDKYDSCPGTICWAASTKDAQVAGEFWAAYRVHLMGTRPV